MQAEQSPADPLRRGREDDDGGGRLTGESEARSRLVGYCVALCLSWISGEQTMMAKIQCYLQSLLNEFALTMRDFCKEGCE